MVPSPLLHAGGRALENVLKLECFRGPALLRSPRSARAFWRCTEMQDIGHQQSDKTCSQRRRDSSAQMVKAEEMALQSDCPSNVSVHVGTAYLPLRARVHNSLLCFGVSQRSRKHLISQGTEAWIRSLPSPEFQQKGAVTVRNAETLWTQVEVCIRKIHTHIPVSTPPTYLNTHTLHSYHPLISTMCSMGMLLAPPSICTHMQSLAICVPQDSQQLLPDAEGAIAAKSYTQVLCPTDLWTFKLRSVRRLLPAIP